MINIKAYNLLNSSKIQLIILQKIITICFKLIVLYIYLGQSTMLQKCQNRKVILQQLLQKSQLFASYFKNEAEQNVNGIMNISGKRNQLLHFGKCEINLPQKVKVNNQKMTGKVMILNKNKKQINKIKQKYQNLSRLRQNQNLRLSLNAAKSQKNIDLQQQLNKLPITLSPQKSSLSPTRTLNNSKQLINNSIRQDQKQIYRQKYFVTSFKDTQIQQESNQVYIEKQRRIQYTGSKFQINNKQYVITPINSERQSNLSYKTKRGQLLSRTRAFSAKVRPQFDLFLKLQNSPQKIYKYNSTFQEKSQTQIITKEKKEQQSKLIKKLEEYKDISINIQNQSSTKNHFAQTNKAKSQQKIEDIGDTNSSTIRPDSSGDSSPTNLFTSPEKRFSSFSVKKYHTNSNFNKNYQQKLQEDKKNKIHFRRELHKIYNRAFVPPPKISAKSYTIYQMKAQGIQQSGKILATINGKNSQQIASLTKIMTCIITLEISQKFKLNLQKQLVQIGKFQTSITGTSALLKIGDIYSVQQLLYGLMLPSGNDASLALGVWGGKQLISNDNQAQNTQPILYCEEKKYYKKDYISRFIQQMNKKTVNLNMTKTKYANTHGLVNSENKSSSIDIALLCQYVMNNQTFCKICSTKSFSSQINYKELKIPEVNNQQIQNNQQQNNLETIQIQRNAPLKVKKAKKQYIMKSRQIKWQNTHYLLQRKSDQYIGIKTGVTTIAGPCLASCIYNKQTNRKFIIVVLNCKNMMSRFKQTQILKRWIYKQQNIPVIKRKRFNARTMSMKQQRSELYQQGQTDMNSDDEQLMNEEKYELVTED